MRMTLARYISSSSGVGWSGRDGSPRTAMLGNNGCRPVASRYGVMPIILLAVIHYKSNTKAKWLVQKLAGVLVRPRCIQSLSILIICLTCLLALLLPTVMW